MAKVNFAKEGSPASAASDSTLENTTTTAVAVVPSNPAPAPYSADDSIGLKDITLPRINIVQKVGDLSNTFDHGSVLLSAELVLFTCPKDPKATPTPLTFLTLGFQPIDFCEKLEGGARGATYNTPAEVVAAGGTIDYNESQATGKPLFQERATALILLEKPEGIDDAHFPHEFEGKKYCTALWSMKGTAFTHGAKVLRTARKIGKLRNNATGGYRSAFYSFATKLTNFKNNWYYIPVLKPTVDSTEALRNWVANEVVGF